MIFNRLLSITADKILTFDCECSIGQIQIKVTMLNAVIKSGHTVYEVITSDELKYKLKVNSDNSVIQSEQIV